MSVIHLKITSNRFNTFEFVKKCLQVFEKENLDDNLYKIEIDILITLNFFKEIRNLKKSNKNKIIKIIKNLNTDNSDEKFNFFKDTLIYYLKFDYNKKVKPLLSINKKSKKLFSSKDERDINPTGRAYGLLFE
jgi:hypothetical protein